MFLYFKWNGHIIRNNIPLVQIDHNLGGLHLSCYCWVAVQNYKVLLCIEVYVETTYNLYAAALCALGFWVIEHYYAKRIRRVKHTYTRQKKKKHQIS